MHDKKGAEGTREQEASDMKQDIRATGLQRRA